MSVATYRQLLECAGSKDILDALTQDDIWEKFEDPECYPEAFTALAR